MAQSKTIHFYSKQTILKMTQTALLLALALVLNFIGSRFFAFPLVSFLKFDFALICVIIACRYVGYIYGLFILLAIFAIAPSYGDLGYSLIGLLGQFLLSFMHFVFMTSYFFLFKAFRKKYRHKSIINKKLFVLQNLTILIIATFITTVALTTINIFLTTPLYFYLFNTSNNPIWFYQYANNWSNYKNLFLGINNYYAALTTVYGSFNILNLTMNCVLIFLLLSINTKAKFIKDFNYFEFDKQVDLNLF